MPLEELHALVETLKERMKCHSAILRASEAMTRSALIDPLLRELGWDTADPTLVIPEYGSGKGRADYALLGTDGKPAMMIEAKSLGTSLTDDASEDSRTQTLLYCLQDGTKHFAVTDGRRWEIYETHREGSINEKLIVEFDIGTQPATHVCLQALALWRPNLKEGGAVAGRTPIILSKLEPSPLPEPMTDEKGWQSLSNLHPAKGDRPPIELRFPDSSHRAAKSWVDVVREVTRWLILAKHLYSDLYPIPQGGNSKWYLVAKNPQHATGVAFTSSEQVETAWIEKNYGAPQQAENARTIVEHVGLDASQFKVRFD